MDLDGFCARYPMAGRKLKAVCERHELSVRSVLPDDDPHCEFSAMFEDPAGDCGILVYVRTTHPTFCGYPPRHGPVWLSEEEL